VESALGKEHFRLETRAGENDDDAVKRHERLVVLKRRVPWNKLAMK
jgi:hypothetical protein